MIQKMNAAAAEVDKHWQNVLQMLRLRYSLAHACAVRSRARAMSTLMSDDLGTLPSPVCLCQSER